MFSPSASSSQCSRRGTSSLKTVYAVMPVLFKSVARIESCLFVYFTAMLLQALIERQARLSMKKRKIASLPVYSEGRECISPAADKLLSAFSEVMTRHLLDTESKIHVFETQLSDKQKLLLTPLGMSPASYDTDHKFEDISSQDCGKQV